MTREFDLEAFLTTFHVQVDDLYMPVVKPALAKGSGPAPKPRSALLGAGGPVAGVPWLSERRFEHHALKHLRRLFAG